MRKRTYFLAIVTIAVSSPLLSQSPATKPITNATAEQQLLRMERDWAKALVDADTSVIERVQSDDFIGWDFEGKPYTKAENIQALKNGYWKTISLDLDDMQIRVFEDLAVVTSRVTRKGRLKDQDLTGEFRWSRVYAERRGRWELVIQLSTRIGSAALPPSSTPEMTNKVTARSHEMSANTGELQVREVENELTNALLHGDAGTLNHLYASDYFHTGTDGVLSNKSDRLDEFRTGSRHLAYLERDDVQIRVYRIAAVVTDADTVQGTFKGKDISGRARAMRVWVRRREGWQLVAAHATAIAP
jgi:ketosteroid isomerase-like protein